MRRGEIWTVSGTGSYARKPRPAVIVQGDQFDTIGSVTICAFTTNPSEAPLFRLPVEPSSANGLERSCRVMVDKVQAVPRSKLGKRLGTLERADMSRLDRALMVFLGLAGAA